MSTTVEYERGSVIITVREIRLLRKRIPTSIQR